MDKNEEMERKRRKHEELRRRMTEKGDNSESSPSSSDSEFDDINSNNRHNRNVSRPSSGITAPEVVTSPMSSSSGDQSDKFDGYSVNINSSHPEKEKFSKHLQDLVVDVSKSSTNSSKSSTLEHNFDVQNLIENVIQESQLLSDDNGANEPDIVRSTKTRTPPSTLQTHSQQPSVIVTPSGDKIAPSAVDTNLASSGDVKHFVEPVAPPRRKKKGKTLSLQRSSDNLVSAFIWY